MYKTQIRILGVAPVCDRDGNVCDYCRLHFSYPSKSVLGLAVGSSWCPSSIADELVVGDTYDAVLYSKGGKYNVYFP